LRFKSEKSKLLDGVLAALADRILSHLEQAVSPAGQLMFLWGVVFTRHPESHRLLEERSIHELDACLFSKEELNSCRRKTQIS